MTPQEQTHASAAWKQDNGSVHVITMLDPENAPADKLIAELAPPECPERDEGGTTFVHDRQPYERDGWTGELNTSLATQVTGSRYYVVSYLLHKGDALVNVIADGTTDQTATFNPTVDETAAHYVELVLTRFAA